ncbi:biotin/lipoyl-binding protein [Arthrobacter sp. AK01]|uniref:biotin/lipoyl-containing protein n=1 Tax=Micrococcaceae TaxID=1268 RepID=UPI001E40C441|nr:MULTISPECIES: biotin/lipoyl-containing protein [Micrococcaceae]MCD4853428.1 biotin/lipoyl-binding protein [Arthrobacter sp. AK01]MCP1413768.1 pyruvate/2-oxoglutarate dehydrogenase complex dihydrolipoamide acyltransferase (E2) component [Paenarthrobacter sp. A20]
MANEFPLPKWGVTMESGTIAEWNVSVGDTVTEGQILATIDTDKITVELEAPTSGIVGALLAQEGDDVEVGAPVITIASDQQDYESYRAGL